MTVDPTRGAGDDGRQGWVRRPALAWTVRVLLFLFPIVVGWLAVRFTKTAFFQPPGWPGFAVWVGQAIVVSTAAALLATRLGNRLAPVSALFRLTLIFPDHAPSRFGVALRSGTVRQLTDELALSSTSVQAAAEQAVAMVAELGRHERLTRGHTERVRAHAELIGQEMELSDEEMHKLRWGVLLHDIGKLTVPPEVLNKQEKLTEEEWQCLRGHPAAGARMIAPLRPWLGDWADAAGQHHERWDGKGYPSGLSGTGISLAGRITAVADAYDVITSKRSYKAALSSDAARKELWRCSGAQFDPAVVRAALRIGLREPRRLGLISWLAELPGAVRVASSAGSAGTAMATAAVAVVASVGGVEVEPAPPEALASVGVVETVEAMPDETPEAPASVVVQDRVAAPPSSSTTAAPTSTTTTSTTTTTAMTEPTPTTTTAAPATTTTAAPATTTTAAAAPTSTMAAPTTTTTSTTTTTAAPTTTTTTTTTTTSTTTTTTTTTTIPPTGFELISAADLPSDLADGTLESATVVRVFRETVATPLANDLTLKAHVDGVAMDGNTTATTVLASGTVVCTWFVHGDVPSQSSLNGTFDFGETILGLALSVGELDATNDYGLDSIAYDSAGVEKSDSLTVTGTELEVTLQLIDTGLDQIRVFTAC